MRNLPRSAGVGFKPEHYAAILDDAFDIGFFEIHAENYMGAGGLPHAQLAALRADHALSVHGVGLSIGGPGPLNPDHLTRLKQLCDRYQPGVSPKAMTLAGDEIALILRLMQAGAILDPKETN